jgi:hypothetical protein
MPIGFEMDVVNSSNVRVAHNFYANGAVNFNGNISANNLGNIISVNLDGNASNILDGTGNWIAVPSSANANYANFAGQVVDATQSNITSVGNLTTLQVGNSVNDTLRFVPAGSNLTLSTGNVVVAQTRITTATAPTDATILSGNAGGATYTQQLFVPDGSNVATAGSVLYSADSALGAGNAAVPGSITQRVFTGGSDLTTGNTGTSLDMILGGGGVLVNQKTAPSGVASGTGIIQTISYGESANAAASVGLRFQRRRGNNNNRLSLEPNDYVGNIEWRPGRGASNFGTPARFGARVDGSYTANTNPVPIGIEMSVVNSSNTALVHSFYANGNVSFASSVSVTGNITATNLGNIASINLDGSSSNVLYGNGVFASTPTPTKIQNGNSIVDFSGSGGDLRINIDGQQYATFQYGRKLSLTGVEGDYANASQIVLDNGGIQVINEDLLGGLPSFEFKSYYTTGGTIAPYVFQRARGNLTNPANAQSGDAIMNQTFQAYSNTGFTSAGSFSATVTNNDNAGNIRTRIETGTANNGDGSEIKLNTDIITLYGNSLITLNATNSNVSGSLNVTGNVTANNANITNTTTTKLIEQNLGTSNLSPGSTLNLASNVEQYYKITLTTGAANSTSTINCANLDTAGVGKTYRFLVFNNSGGNQTVQTSGLAQYNPTGVIQNNKYSLIDVILHGTDGSAVFTLDNVA